MLRELNKGEKVLVIKAGGYGGNVGDIGTIDEEGSSVPFCLFSGVRFAISRKKLLAIGDKVVRGPDWEQGDAYGDIGTVEDIQELSKGPENVGVRYPNGRYAACKMTPNHQDLKPTGDSEGADKEHDPYKKAFGVDYSSHAVDAMKYMMANVIKQPQEDTMTREARAVVIDKSVKEKGEALSDYVAQENEKIDDLKAEAVNLRAYTTDKEEIIAQIVSVKKCTKKQAKDWLALKDKGIEV